MTDADIENRFTYHAPKNDQTQRYEQLREHAKRFAYLIKLLTPESREQTRALNHLDECTMLANSAIARNERSMNQIDWPTAIVAVVIAIVLKMIIWR